MRLYRFRTSDIPKVRDMFCEAFALDCYSKSRFVMRHLLDHYLCGYLSCADMAVTAIENGVVDGFLLGCTGKRRGRTVYGFLKAYHSLFLPFSKGGRAYIRCKRLIENADASMRAEAPPPESELLLFVVRAERRGNGTGRMMLDAFRRHLVENGVRNMQLFTDDYSDVGYYRSRGYEQLGLRHIEFIPGEDSCFYLFTIPVEKIGAHNR